MLTQTDKQFLDSSGFLSAHFPYPWELDKDSFRILEGSYDSSFKRLGLWNVLFGFLISF